MRRRNKYKQTFLSNLFIDAFLLIAGTALGSVPVIGTLFDIVAQDI